MSRGLSLRSRQIAKASKVLFLVGNKPGKLNGLAPARF